jgi:hypothetical protein
MCAIDRETGLTSTTRDWVEYPCASLKEKLVAPASGLDIHVRH